MRTSCRRAVMEILAGPAVAALVLVASPNTNANTEGKGAAPHTNPEPIAYTVAPGNNLFRLALEHGTTVEAIQRANGLNSTRIHVGQTLAIPQGEKAQMATTKGERASTAQPSAAAHGQDGHAGPAHWEYEGPSGPEAWGKLSPEFVACSEGQAQTPIDVSKAVPMGLSDIKFHYQPGKGQVVNNGHTIQVNYAQGSSIEVDGQSYNLAQFHFHTPSEHTVNGKRYDMELHFVHKNEKGQLAVVGVLMDKGANNEALTGLWAALPQEAGAQAELTEEMALTNLLPANRRVFRYSGSLTTPPCSEGVKWLLMESPIVVSDAQVQAFQQLFPHNSRPVQPLNNRVVLLDADSE